MHTEEKAREKWCPFARMIVCTNDDKHAVLNASSFNRAIPEGEDGELLSLRGARCIASDCMAWRGAWRKIVKDRYFGDEEEILPQPIPPHKDWERVGYCGLAGNQP